MVHLGAVPNGLEQGANGRSGLLQNYILNFAPIHLTHYNLSQNLYVFKTFLEDT